jgi:dihydroorotate dehydrogenase (fumarate)
MNIDLSARLAGYPLRNCLMNASGPWCSRADELHAVAQSAAAAIVSKSCTLRARSGNPAPRYQDTDWGSINAMGLPNEGWRYYADCAGALSQYAKPYILSVSGMTPEDNLYILQQLQAQTLPPAAVELNLSCPNLVGKPQTAYDEEQTRRLLDQVFSFFRLPLGVKLPPYFDPVHFDRMASLLAAYPLAFVTCINSIGNGLAINIDEECTLIRPKDGLGGLGGAIVKPTALANVREFRRRLPAQIAVIGCGGIATGRDAFEHLLCGAEAVQIGTQFYRERTACFERIERELAELMQQKGYASLSDFRGKLRTI